jgi:hypothetical protein
MWSRASTFLSWLLLIAAGLLGAAFLWSTFCTTPLVIWNPPRLAPTFAIAYGLDPYAAGDSALHMGMMYMPMFALWNLPATLAPNLTSAFAIEWALNVVAIFLPAWLLFRWVWPERRLAWAALLATLLIRLSSESAASAFLFLHLDALCIGFVLVAALALLRAIETRSSRACAIAGIFAAASVWTKQLAVVAPVALLTWSLWQRRPTVARRFLFWCLGTGLAFGVIFCAWFGPEKLYFSTYLLPSRLPREINSATLRELGVTFLDTHWLWCVLWLALGSFVWRQLRHAQLESRGTKLCALMLWLALWHLPLGFLAQFIPGGALNSLYTLNFASVALAWAAVERWRAAPITAGSMRLPRLLVGALAVGASVFALSRFQTIWRPNRYQDQLVSTAYAHRGKIYFPFNPLVTLFTEKRILPFDDAISDLSFAGLLPPVQRFQEVIPPDVEIMMPEGVEQSFVCDLLGRSPHPSISLSGGIELQK